LEGIVAKILIADDAAFMRLRCAKLLKENGHEVVEAEDGAQAVKLYQEISPDAVLLDITMPNMDGLTALKEIRKLNPDARVAMVTAMGQKAMVLDAIKSGAKDFVVKPFEAERVLGAVKKLVG
jgi:two-component system, chemotaxis family, chemotaxis protein CheY